MPRSLRVRLLAWYNLILTVVITTFAVTLGFLLWRSLVVAVDTRLQLSGARLVQGLRPAGVGEFDLDLPLEFQPVEASDQDTTTYYAIWNAQGEAIDRSPVSFDVPMPAAAGVRTRDGRREMTLVGAEGARVLVGHDLVDARAAVLGFAGTSAVGGIAALLLSFAGGWFLIGRALAPVGRINRAARAMADGNLAARIAVESTESELEDVAQALNGAFDRLHRALDSQRRFTTDASHELRTPLATLGAELEWALARPRSSDEYRSSVLTCKRVADRMASLVDRLLRLARADHDAGVVERTRMPLEQIVREAVAQVQPLAVRRGISVDLALDETRVEGDRESLIELVLNLCSNAIEYNRDGGWVKVEVSSEGPEACLWVRDSGVGISAADQPRVFERFFRPDQARARRTGGAGLGLAIAKRIVEAHGGRIDCRSTIGEGTEMIVRLPRV